MQRIDYFDTAKGLAIFFVVMGHVVKNIFHGGDSTVGVCPIEDFIQSFQMACFAMLSGLVASNINNTEWGAFLYKNFRRLLIPFFLFGVLHCFCFQENWWDLFSSEYKCGLWYLLALFLWLSLTKLLPSFYSIKKTIAEYVIVLLVCFVSLYSCRYIPASITGCFSMHTTFSFYPYFLLGFFISRFSLHDICFSSITLLLISIGAFIVSYGNNWLRYVTGASASLVLISSCKVVSNRFRTLSTVLTKCGRNSLYVYIFHLFIVPIFAILCRALNLIDNPCFTVELVSSVFISCIIVIISLVIGGVINKWEWLKRIVFFR